MQSFGLSLEPMLHDCAVIRTTFATMDLFSREDPIRDEMMEIVDNARENLAARLQEVRDKALTDPDSFIGIHYDTFKEYALAVIRRGYPRRNLDSMLKIDLFAAVAEAEGQKDLTGLQYHFEFTTIELEQVESLPASVFIGALFEEILVAAQDDRNFTGKYSFDKNVFQKFALVLFLHYATSDPWFYGL